MQAMKSGEVVSIASSPGGTQPPPEIVVLMRFQVSWRMPAPLIVLKMVSPPMAE